MKELQELRKAMKTERKFSDKVSSTKNGSSSNGTAIKLLFVVFAVLFAISFASTKLGCTSPSSTPSSYENFNDNSSYHQILAKNYFKDHLKEKYLKDPKSYDEINYSSVYNSARECYVVDLKFRAKNSFGGMVIERYMCDVKFEGTNVYFKNITKLE